MVTKINDQIDLECTGFGVFDQSVIRFLLNSVQDYFARLGIVSKKHIITMKGDSLPMCCATSAENLHVIYLTTKDNFWCQWVYQFAHEFCHHLIDGKLSGETAGLMWLEESICHVSSMVCLANFEKLCKANPSLTFYAVGVMDYLSELLKCDDKTNIIPLHMFVKEKAEELATQYNSDNYEYVARGLFPCFSNNPYLWRIIPYLGDMRQWTSIQELHCHLREFATDDYKESLDEMIGRLVSGQEYPDNK
ncbi:MAG: hypothetical protein IKN60_01920 [Bacteroidales bacterium]|nr:hypothetical protein [Bacteroidales bacterium]